jgi:hypothetical protein
MNPEEQKCPICERIGVIPHNCNPLNDICEYTCPICGHFSAIDDFGRIQERNFCVYQVQGALRERALKTGKLNVLFIYDEKDVSNYNQKRLNPEKGLIAFSIKSLLESVDIPKNPMQQLDRFLQNLAIRLGDSVWGEIHFDQQKDYPLAYAKDNSNAHQLCLEGVKLKYFRKHADYIGIAMKGWERIEELKKGNKSSKQGFVACWFDDSHDLFRKAMERGIEKAGFEAMSIKEKHYSEPILEKGIRELVF